MTSPGTAPPSSDFQSYLNSYLATQSATDTGSQVYDPFGFTAKEAKTNVNEGVNYVFSDPSGHHIDKANTKMVTETVEQLAENMAKLAQSPNPADQQQWKQMQAQMAVIGAYGTTGKYTPGGFTKNDISALHELMQGYIASGTATGSGNADITQLQTFSEYVDQQTKAAVDAGKTAAAVGPTKFDPNSLKSEGTSASQSLLGRDLTSDQQGAFASQENSAQASSGSLANNVNVDPSADAQQFVVNNNKPEYQAHQVEGYMNAFANMFLSGSSSRAQTGVGTIGVPSGGAS